MTLGMVTMAYGQSMTETQILQIVQQEKKKGTPESDIATMLLQKGATLEQIQKMREKYASQLEKASMGGVADKAIGDAQNRMRQNNSPLKEADPRFYRQQQMGNLPTEWMYSDDPAMMGMYQSPDSLYFAGQEGKKVFGRDIFNNKSLTFEPQMNIATPQNYVLGPGDQLIIDVYGDTQKSEQLPSSAGREPARRPSRT